MKIETDDWVTLAEACKEAGLSQSTGYRLAKHLDVIAEFFGVKCVKKSDVDRMKSERRRVGNQRWIASGEQAAEDSAKAVESRLVRIKSSGITKAERRRNKQIAQIGRTLGGRRTAKKS